eukprot:TRINITY_DN2054_c0_g1_i1.p1 TRINITY_DN2054_c0_g1~~TRINITY_DN2054_c0_g1_i1.p1  ORF type:complete len:916 (+),score=210.92 TRINITY_DN2054_c0_g1_i1:96-2750(+)
MGTSPVYGRLLAAWLLTWVAQLALVVLLTLLQCSGPAPVVVGTLGTILIAILQGLLMYRSRAVCGNALGFTRAPGAPQVTSSLADSSSPRHEDHWCNPLHSGSSQLDAHRAALQRHTLQMTTPPEGAVAPAAQCTPMSDGIGKERAYPDCPPLQRPPTFSGRSGFDSTDSRDAHPELRRLVSGTAFVATTDAVSIRERTSHRVVTAEAACQAFPSGSHCCPVFLRLTDGGLAVPAYSDVLPTTADCEEAQPLWGFLRLVEAACTLEGCAMLSADPFTATVVLSCRADGAAACTALAVALIRAVPPYFKGFRIVGAAGPPRMAEDAKGFFCPLGPAQIAEGALMIILAAFRRTRMLLGAYGSEPPVPGLAGAGGCFGGLRAWVEEQRGPQATTLTKARRARDNSNAWQQGFCLVASVFGQLAMEQPDAEHVSSLFRIYRHVWETVHTADPGSLATDDPVKTVLDRVRPMLSMPTFGDTKLNVDVDWESGVELLPEVYGAQEMIEPREDRWFAFRDLRVFQPTLPPGYTIFGVMDGHAGRACAEFVQQQITPEVAVRLAFGFTAAAAVQGALMALDRIFVQRVGSDDGCTATIVLVTKDKFVVGNLGDSRAVGASSGDLRGSSQCSGQASGSSRLGAATAGKYFPIRLTADHLASDPGELGTIESKGGAVIWTHGAFRVDGKLQVSRSMGDRPVREATCQRPDVSVLARHSCEFIVAASDGLWGEIGDSEVVQIVGAAREALDSGSFDASASLSTLGVSDRAASVMLSVSHARMKVSMNAISGVSASAMTPHRETPVNELPSIPFNRGQSGGDPRVQSPSRSFGRAGAQPADPREASVATEPLNYSAIASGLAMEAQDRAAENGHKADDITVVIAFFPRRAQPGAA